ncbi:MAG: sensor histidine kinase [Francisellaceae bacterium]
MIKTKLARRTYGVLISGLIFSGFLLALMGYQFSQLGKDSIYGRVAQMNIQRVINDKSQTLEQLKQRLERIPGLNVDIRSIDRDIRSSRSLLVIKSGEFNAPFDWSRPFILEFNNHRLLITFTPWNRLTLIAGIYVLVMLILVFLMLMLCYWAVRRLEKINQIAREAMSRLAENIYADITLGVDSIEARALFNDVRKIQNILREIINKRTEMLAAISHDLKTPIARLKLRIELMEQSQIRRQLLNDIDNIEKMVSSILGFTKNFTLDEKSVKFDLSELVESIVFDAEDMGHQIYSDISPEIHYIGRIMGLKRAITNIVDNAIKYGKLGIVVSLWREDSKIICQISDQGAGVDVEVMSRLFDPFYRVDSARTSEIAGSGLGLSIAKEIIEAHGGEIKISPNKPSGLVVQIIFTLLNI